MELVEKINRSGDLVNKFCRDGIVVNKAYRDGDLVYQRIVNNEANNVMFTIISGGTIVINKGAGRNVQYRIDNGLWVDVVDSAATVVNVQAGETFKIKSSYMTSGFTFEGSTAYFNLSGELVAIGTGPYNNMFSNTNVVDASELVFPNENNIFRYMFAGCTAMTKAPAILPATALTIDHLYWYMFAGCTSLTVAPVLPATTLAYGCYDSMFSGCTSLEIAPELPATELRTMCYKYMFKDCTSLNYIKCLATEDYETDSTLNWTSNVSSTGTFVKAASMTDWDTGVNGIPTGWTVESA